jgi:hypothetical protein
MSSKIYVAFFLSLLILFKTSAQNHKKYFLPYRSQENPHYWKNTTFSKDYWQQDVKYQVKAVIDDSLNTIDIKDYKLTYFNNSPDNLKELYFHLYDNAYQKNSYYHDLWTNNKLTPKFGKYENQGKNLETYGWTINGKNVKTELDNTILKVYLDTPLLPNDSLVVACKAKFYWDSGSMRRRSLTYKTQGYKHFNGVHWYPIICVYDKYMGWHTDQHLDKEFYANFGSFDVELTFPAPYIVEGSGVLLNKKEVLPDSLRKAIDLKNFANKPLGSKASEVVSSKNKTTKTWKFYGNNIHNFAFTADPLYRIEELPMVIPNTKDTILVMALAQEPNASKWQASASFTKKVMETYCKDFGNYIWPKIIVADADDGMEYPMLTLDGGLYPQHRYLLAHEVGHQWFYGMVGSNETYRAYLDEGFTQFLTIWSMDKIIGKKQETKPPYKIWKKQLDSAENRMDRLYRSYLTDVWTGYDQQLNTHSSGFNGAIRMGGGYRSVYMKTGVMLYNLQYVLGDSLFKNAMQHYVKKWTGKHPYPQDFRDAITEFVQTDLSWFFDEWLETTKYIDYKVKSIKKISQNILKDSTEYEIVLKRKGSMQMPVDIEITNSKNEKQLVLIPNTWFVKDTSAQILPKWYGWDLLKPTYKVNLKVAGTLSNLEIDPSRRLADMDRSNNRWKKNQKWQTDFLFLNPPSWEKKNNYWRPDIWWNGFDGIQAGVHLHGDYFQQNHLYEASVWVNSGIGQTNDIPQTNKNDHQWVAFSLWHKNNLSKTWKMLASEQAITYNAGLWKGNLLLEKTFRKQDLRNPRYSKITLQHGFLYRPRQVDSLYVLYPDNWSSEKINSFIQAQYQYFYPTKTGNGIFSVDVRTPGIANDFNYSFIQLSNISSYNLNKFELKTRTFARFGFGNTPLESALYLSGASPEELYNNKYTRAVGFVPQDWLNYGTNINHFQMGGGLNLRGYAGYLAPQEAGNGQIYNYVGKSGTSFSFELDFDKFIPIKGNKYTKNIHFDTYLFHDMGLLTYLPTNQSEQKMGKLRTSSGLGSVLTMKFGLLNVKPIAIRFDMPLLLNAPPAGQDYFQWRFVVGLNRSF